MKKKVFNNVILALCVLALVLQPLASYADSFYDATTLGRFIKPFSTILDEDINLSNTVFDIASHYNLTKLYDLSSSNVICFNSPNGYTYLYYMDPDLYTVTVGVLNPQNNASFGLFDGISNTRLTVNYYYYNPANNTYGTGSANSTSFGQVGTVLFFSDDFKTNDGRSLFIDVSSGSDFPDIPDLSGVNTSSPNSLYIPLFLSVFQNYAHKLYSEFPSYVAGSNDDGTLIYKSYETGALWYLLITNCSIMETYFNHQYGFFNNISGNLASFANNQNEISEYVSSVIPSVEQIESELIDINNKLDMAFPDDQADMNDAIADQILDDSNGNGLTIDKISSAKSDLDDGLDTFKLDVSDAQYSNPFSALGDADWSFWSQTTLNNLGSGYSFEYSDAALMDGEDVFDVNQRTLLDLLGW